MLAKEPGSPAPARPGPSWLKPALGPAPQSAPGSKPVAATTPADRWEAHPFRRFFLICALAALFLRLSVLPELIAYLTNADTYLLYVVTPPALLGTVLLGGIGRTFKEK